MERFDQRFVSRITESWVNMPVDELVGFLTAKCQEVLTVDKLTKLLKEKPILKIKFGIDPTATMIHLGHVVPIMLLQQFMKVGHHVDFIIGDFTARVGDPTARDTGRTPLSSEKITENMKTYTAQIGRFIDTEQLTIHHNADWLNKMTLQEIFAVFQQVNLSEAIQREDFRVRTRNEQAVSLAEVCYGILMGIDSVHLSTDIEIGGIDQLLNFQQCRKIMRQQNMEEEVILMTPILEGTNGDGRKMSKSYNNFVAVTASHEEKFGKIMSIPDRLIGQYFRCFADVHQRELGELDAFVAINPFEAKKQLATLVIAIETRNLEDGEREREAFERKFSKGTVSSEDCVRLVVNAATTLFDVLMLSSQFKSKGELRRMFEQNAVRFVNETAESVLASDSDPSKIDGIVRVGKRKFFRIVTG